LEQTHATAVNTLNGRMETLAAPEYMRLRAAADEARIDSEVARLNSNSTNGFTQEPTEQDASFWSRFVVFDLVASIFLDT
jgi:hypothetical protein